MMTDSKNLSKDFTLKAIELIERKLLEREKEGILTKKLSG